MNETRTCADVAVECLIASGVDVVFAITGAGNLAIIDAIARQGGIKLVFTHHEQAAVMAAQGYSRSRNSMGVALVTTGGGASNSLTGALSANLDSIPILVISGNESSFHCREMAEFRAFGVQGFDSVASFAPVSKYSKRISRAHEVKRMLTDAIEATTTPRSGVAFLDFPMDIQRQPYAEVENLDLVETKPELQDAQDVDVHDVLSFIEALERAESPLIYLGNGARQPEALATTLAIIESTQTPFMLSWSALDLVPDEHPLNMGRIGIYGDRASNLILQRCDLLLSLGSRLAIPQIGYDQNDFARNAQRWVVDVDRIELTKFHGERWSLVHGTVESFVHRLASILRDLPELPDRHDWIKKCRDIWSDLPRAAQTGDEVTHAEYLHSNRVIEELNSAMSAHAIVVTDVGAGLLSGHYSLESSGSNRIFTSQGLGEMGFGLPASIGAAIAEPGREVVCLNTDGGIMFNLQELQTVKSYELPIKIFIFNNSGYSMIRISQQNLFEGRYVGVDSNSGVSFPNFESIATAFGLEYRRLNDPTRLDHSLREALCIPGPVVIEVVMSPEQRYLPRLATKRLSNGSLSSPPLEDMDPQIDLDRIERHLGQRAHPRSYEARGRILE